MVLFGYGEDSLTFWALTSALGQVLSQLADNDPGEQCTVFYRPSFGRKGGDKGSEFGEFDFIILAPRRIYLGESKWERPGGRPSGLLNLNAPQTKRHETMRLYIKGWFARDWISWDEFAEAARADRTLFPTTKPVPGPRSILYANLGSLFRRISDCYEMLPEILNVLLFFHCGPRDASSLPSVPPGFLLVHLDYGPVLQDRYVRLGATEGRNPSASPNPRT